VHSLLVHVIVQASKWTLLIWRWRQYVLVHSLLVHVIVQASKWTLLIWRWRQYVLVHSLLANVIVQASKWTLLIWRWRQNVLVQCSLSPNELHNVVKHTKNTTWNFTDRKSSNLIRLFQSIKMFDKKSVLNTTFRVCRSKSKIRTQMPVTHRHFFLNNQPDALIIPILFCFKTLQVSGIFSAHHQEFSTVHLALVSFMQVFDDRFQAESGWNILTLLESGHNKPAWNLPVPNGQ